MARDSRPGGDSRLPAPLAGICTRGRWLGRQPQGADAHDQRGGGEQVVARLSGGEGDRVAEPASAVGQERAGLVTMSATVVSGVAAVRASAAGMFAGTFRALLPMQVG